MGVLSNARHERFVQEIVKGKSQSEAYIAAGFAASAPGSAKANSARLGARPEIQARLRELQGRSAHRAEIESAGIIRMLIEDRDRAHENKQAGAAVRASELLGKQIGMFIERRDIRTGPLDDLDLESLEYLRDVVTAEKARRAAGEKAED
jgi:phage terminase small subunit